MLRRPRWRNTRVPKLPTYGRRSIRRAVSFDRSDRRVCRRKWGFFWYSARLRRLRWRNTREPNLPTYGGSQFSGYGVCQNLSTLAMTTRPELSWVQVKYTLTCGWRFTDSENSTACRLTKSDFTLICGVCLPKQRKAARLTVQIVEPAAPDHSSVSSDSSVSSV